MRTLPVTKPNLNQPILQGLLVLVTCLAMVLNPSQLYASSPPYLIMAVHDTTHPPISGGGFIPTIFHTEISVNTSIPPAYLGIYFDDSDYATGDSVLVTHSTPYYPGASISMLSYFPNYVSLNYNHVTGSSGIDSFNVYFCDSFSNCIALIVIVRLSPGPPAGDSVWPGDANHDGIANNLDVLNIGIAYTDTGASRAGASITWMAQYCDFWSSNFASGENYHHADCNGDGVVYSNDTLAIAANYGLIHPKSTGSSGSGIPLYLTFPADTFYAGDTITGDLMLGDITTPASDVYGLAFGLGYDTSIVVPGTLKLTFNDSWFAPDGNRMGFVKDIVANNMADAAVTRIDKTNTSGLGQIGTVSIIIHENIVGKNYTVHNLNLDFYNVLLIGLDEIAKPVDALSTILSIKQETNSIHELPLETFAAYPNPVQNELNINFGTELTGKLSVYDVSGKLLINKNIAAQSSVLLNTTSLPSGFYSIVLENISGDKQMGLFVK